MKLSLLSLLACATLLFLTVEATHFRFGTITWSISSVQDYNTVFFTVNTGWRRSFYDPLNGNPGHASPSNTQKVQVGDTLIQQTYNNGQGRYYNFNPGDGNGDRPFTGQFVTSINEKDDWIMTTWNYTYRYPSGDGDYVAYHTQSARISTLKNNADQPWIISTKVTIRRPPSPVGDWTPNNSPVTSALPIIPVRYGVDLVYTLPGYDPDAGDIVVFSNADPQTMGGNAYCPELTVEPSTGVVRFLASKTNTILIGAYQTQQILTDTRGASIPVDYILNVTLPGGFCQCPNGQISNTPCTPGSSCSGIGCTGATCLLSDPAFIFNTTTAGRTTQVTPGPDKIPYDAGDFINIPIVADDLPMPATDDFAVEIYSSGVPSGASITTQGKCNNANCRCVGSDCKNPQVVYLRWQTLKTTRGIYSVCFGVVQSKTTPATYYAKGQTCISLEIRAPKCNSGSVDTTNPICNSDATFVAEQCCKCPPGFDPASRCLSCLKDYWGPNCQQCPNCNNGTCSDGLGGDGTCICDPGYSGTNCQNPNFKFCDPSQASYIQSQTTSDSSALNPTTAFVYMAVRSDSTGTASVPFSLKTPSLPSLDVVFVQDLSASTLQADINSLNTRIGPLVNSLASLYPGSSVSFASIAGTPSTYRSYGPLTSFVPTLSTYISKMQIDGTASQASIPALSAVSQASLDRNFQWRFNSYRVVVLLTRKRDSGAITYTAFSEGLASNSANVMFLVQSAGVGPSAYNSVLSNFGLASATGTNQEDWNTVFLSTISQLVQQIAVGVTKDTNNMFVNPGLTTAPLGRTTGRSVSFNFPSGVTKGTIRVLPNPIVSFLGWASSSVTIVLNRAPTSQNSIFTAVQDVPYPFQIPSADADNNLLNVRFTQLPSNGAITNNGSAIALNTPIRMATFSGVFLNNYLWNGQTTFKYILNDGCDDSAEYTATITVTPVNYPPTAQSNNYSLDQGSSITITFTPLLNDVDNLVADLRVFVDNIANLNGQITTGSRPISGGELTDQRLVYTPSASFYGTSNLTYYARDNQGQSTTAVITFSVRFINKNPTFSGPSAPTIAIGSTTTFTVSISDVDIPDSANITYTSNLKALRVTGAKFTYAPTSTEATLASPSLIFRDLPSNPGPASFSVAITTDDLATGSLGSITFGGSDRYGGSASITINPVAAANTNPFFTTITYINSTGIITTLGPNNKVVLTGDQTVTVVVLGSDNDGTQGAKLAFAVTSNPSSGTIFTGASNTQVPSTLPTGGYVFNAGTERTTPGPGSRSSYSFVYKPNEFFFGSDSVTISYKDVLGGVVSRTINFDVLFVNHLPTLRASDSVTLPIGKNYTLSFVVSDPDSIDSESITVGAYSLNYIQGIWYSRNGVVRYLGSSLSNGQSIATGLSPRDSFELIILTTDNAVSSLGSLTLTVLDSFGGSGTSTVTFTAANSAPPVVVQYSPVVTLAGDGSILLSVKATDPDGQQGANLNFIISSVPQYGTITTGKAGSAISANTPFPSSENYPVVLSSDSTSNYTFVYTPNKFWSGIDSFKFFVRDVLSATSPVYTTTLNVTFVNHAPTLTGPTSALCKIGFNCRITFSLSDPDPSDFQEIILRNTSITGDAVDPTNGASLVVSGSSSAVNLAGNNISLRQNVLTGTGGIIFYLDLQIKGTFSGGNMGNLIIVSKDSNKAFSRDVTVALSTSNNNPPYESAASSSPPSFTTRADQNLVLTLTASDDDDGQTDTVKLVITSLPKNGTLLTSSGITLDRNNFQTPISKNSAPNSTFTITYKPNEYTHGSDSFSYYYVDVPGAQSQIYSAGITTTFFNHAPTVTSSSSSYTCPLGANCTIPLSVFDPDVPDAVDLVLVEYTLISVGSVYTAYSGVSQTVSTVANTEFQSDLLSGSTASLILKVDDVANGPLGTIKIKGKDIGGLESSVIEITISAGANSPPEFVSQTPQNPVPLAGDSDVKVVVVGSDPDGNQGQNLKLVILSSPASGYINTTTVRVPSTLPNGGFVFNTAENTPGVVAGSGDGSSEYSFFYVPNKYFNGKDSFTYAFVDPMGSSTPPITIEFNVTFTNHPPVISTLSTNVVCGFGKNCTMDFTIVDYDDANLDHESVEIDLFTLKNVVAVYAVNPATGQEFKLANQPQGVILSNLATRSSARLIVTFDSEISGNLGTFHINARDSYNAASDVLTISVNAESNNPPRLLTPAPSGTNTIEFSLKEDGNITITVTGTDADGTQGNSLKLVLDRLPSNGKIIDSNGQSSTDGLINPTTNTPFTGATPGTSTSTYSFTYIPDPLFYGTETFTFHFVDVLNSTSVSYTAVLEVEHVNHPPTGSSFSASGMSSVPLPLNQFIGNDIDKIDVVSLEIISLPTNGILRDADNNTITLSSKRAGASPLYSKDKWTLWFTSDDYVSGAPLTSFQFRFFDGQAYSLENYTATINIELSNAVPEAFPVEMVGELNQMLIFVANATDANDAPGTLTINIIQAPSGGLFCTDEALFNCYSSGNIYRNESTPIYYKPNQNQYGTPYDYFIYSVSDPSRATSKEVNVSITIKFVNKPPVAEFDTVITVYENDQVTFTLSASDDRTPVPDLKFVVDTAPLKGNLTSTTDDGTEYFTNENVPFTLLESRVLTFAPAYLENGDNYTSFRVVINDTDGGSTIVTVIFNVIPVNQAPVIHYNTRFYTTRMNERTQIGFTGTDVDSPLSSLVGVITRFPQRGTLYSCANWTVDADTCELGNELKPDPNVLLQTLPSVGDAIWRFVFVPFENQVSRVYATPSFIIVDDKLARSETYTVSIGVLAVNKPPAANASVATTTTVGQSTLLRNVTAVDSDAGALPIMVVLSVNEGKLNFSEETAFKSSANKPAPCRSLEEGKVLNCTGSQFVIANFLPTITYINSQTGNYTFTIFVDDLGAGAESNERATSRLTATASSSIQVESVVVPAPTSRNLSLAIGLASAGGALFAAAAVGAVARFLKKPDDSLFQNMLDFDQSAVLSNPLYEGNEGQYDNALYEDEGAV